ncbi:MAG: PrsW family glutamic-type intramembrane protease [Spirochaetia bacterium]|jgi:RsiW-degrading membrane proteinase PrsW (M82 family)|nr:PrsW family glutamic-type intramembrane protease [Spirochaetia bacterium]
MIQLLLILIINTLVLIAWGKYLHHLDAFTVDKKNEHTLFWFIVTGSILNTILVSMMYPLWENILFSLTGLGFGINPFITHFLIVGPVEEFTKFLIFIFLAGMFQSIKEPRDGILQAVSVALGFALMENFLYALKYGVGVLLLRSILGVIGHSTYAAIWGFAWSSTVYTAEKNSKSPDRYYVLPSIIFASMFHGAYNTLLDYNYVLFALLIKVITLGIFFLIYRFVRDNSPYKKYSLKEYKRAIPALKMGLNKYPKSYLLNKRMGVFNIYTRKYRTAEGYLKKATKNSPRKTGGRFYYGVSRYLNGNTTDGIRLMYKAVSDLPVNMRKRPVDSLNNIISIESDRKAIMGHFDEHSLQFTLNKGKVRKSNTATQIRYPSKQKMEDLSGKSSISQTIKTDSIECRGTWERLVRVRPEPVLIKPYKIGGNSIVNRAGKSYRNLLDEKVEEWKRAEMRR